MTTLQQAFPADVRRFSKERGLDPYVDTALQLIERHFPDALGVRAELIEDPDDGGPCIVLTVGVHSTAAQMLPRDDRFMEDWVKHIPEPAIDQIVMLLDYL